MVKGFLLIFVVIVLERCGGTDMRQYFYKTSFLLSIFIMVAVLFTLCGIAVVNGKRPNKILSVLSDDYLVVYDTEGKYKKISEYVDLFEGLQQSCTLGVKLEDDFGCALYSTDGRLSSLQMAEGRVFTKEDYEKGADVVLLREDLKSLCEIIGEKSYFHYLGATYEVIGFYKDYQKKSICSCKYIFNIASELLNQTQGWKIGFYDNGKESLKVLDEALGSSGMRFFPLDTKKGNIYGNTASNMKLMLGFYIIVALMVLLNVYMATITWLKGRKKEIVIKKMVGASKVHIYKWLIFDFMSLILLSFFVGVAVVKFILVSINTWEISSSMVMMFGNRLEWLGILIAFIIVMVIGFTVIIVTLRKYLKHEIIEVVRSE